MSKRDGTNQNSNRCGGVLGEGQVITLPDDSTTDANDKSPTSDLLKKTGCHVPANFQEGHIYQERNGSEQKHRTLFYCEEVTDCDGFKRLFESCGFPVVVCHTDSNPDFDDYGALVHLAKSNRALIDLLGERFTLIPDEEWILVSGDDDDLHCTVELTKRASTRLRTFVRSLWSKFSVP